MKQEVTVRGLIILEKKKHMAYRNWKRYKIKIIDNDIV